MTTGETDSSAQHLLATVAHELQTPLAAIRAATDVLDDNDAKARLAASRVIRDAAARLTGLIDDLLLAARLDAGTLPVRLSPCDAGAVAAQAAELVRAGTGASIEVESDGPAPVLADADRLRQVIANLLTNALAHRAMAAGVMVATGTEAVSIVVWDDGPGIPVELREHVFERFARLPGGSVAGTGLGLAIARELTQAMGGAIWIGDGVPHGTAVTVELPVQAG